MFAGWLGDQRPPLAEWDEIDETGLPVHWIATTPWTGWSDRRNYDNAAVAERFGAWLDTTRPDVVHCHSLQSLGAGPLRVAQERGIPTVVTLHDFWWWCARQFLCTRDYRPCSLVVSAGVCTCEVDSAWLDARNSVLSGPLARCDRIVAVSHSTRRVAEANGVDPGRLVVIENGVVIEGAAVAEGAAVVGNGSGRRRKEPGSGVRLTFAGGPNPMKGVQVLADALRQLAARGPWTLAAYGCEEVDILLPMPCVSTPPAYRPDEVRDVLARTDVLVLPSVMRETYSILAREALRSGVPVVTSDSLGPEEVVTDGRNGLVVPAGDAAALAGALDQLIDDPELRARLAGAGAMLRLPTLEAQTDQLVALYDEIRSEAVTPPPLAQRRAVRRVLFVVGIEAAPLRYRARLPAEGLELLGVHTDVCHYRDPAVAPLGERADVIVVYRVPATVQVLQAISAARRRGTPVVFDVDDLIFDPSLSEEIPALSILAPEEAEHWLEGVRRYRLTMEHCDAFVASTEMLVAHAATVIGLPSYRWSNGVGVVLGRLSDQELGRPRAPGPLRIGYLSGTNTHDHDWRYVEPAVARLLEEHLDVELWLVGMVNPTDRLEPFGDRIRRRDLVHWRELPAILRDLDINLAPMEPGSRFNEAKSAIKWVEAALTATPTVASPTGPFAEVITSGVNGMLAEDGTAWYHALSELVADPLLRARMGAAARRDALLDLAPARQGRRYLDILESIAPRPRPPVPTDGVAVYDEPEQPTPLEAYADAGAPDLAAAEIAADIEHQRQLSEAPGEPADIWRIRAMGLVGTVRDGGPAAGARLLATSARRRLAARIGASRRPTRG